MALTNNSIPTQAAAVPLAYFGHHKCASQYIIAVMQSAAYLLGMTTQRVSLVYAPADASGSDETPARLCTGQQRDMEVNADILFFQNAKIAVLPLLKERGGYRGFHVIRDPRDILVSGYFSHLYSHPLNRPWISERRAALSTVSSLEEGLLSELPVVATHFSHMANWHYDDAGIYETRFETLVTAPLAAFTATFRFLGITVPRLGLVTIAQMAAERKQKQRTKQPKMRRRCLPQPVLRRILAKNAFERKSGGRARGQEDIHHHYRKGVPGDWRNYFTPGVKAAFKAEYGELLISQGYESSHDW